MNSEIYEKNMIALRKRFPNLADLVEKKKRITEKMSRNSGKKHRRRIDSVC